MTTSAIPPTAYIAPLGLDAPDAWEVVERSGACEIRPAGGRLTCFLEMPDDSPDSDLSTPVDTRADRWAATHSAVTTGQWSGERNGAPFNAIQMHYGDPPSMILLIALRLPTGRRVVATALSPLDAESERVQLLALLERSIQESADRTDEPPVV